MLHKPIVAGMRKVSPPQPTCMTDDQKRSYLANLRNNRPARPGGARPLPSATTAQTQVGQDVIRSESVVSLRGGDRLDEHSKRFSVPNSNSMPSIGSLRGRPLVPAPTGPTSIRGNIPTQPGAIKFHEWTSRDLEKQEAHSLRQALEHIDHADEETRVYTAAQKEAADLVWKHINPKLAENEKTAAYRNPDLNKQRKQNSQDIVPSYTRRTEFDTSVPTPTSEFDDCKVEALRLPKRGSSDGIVKQMSTMFGNRRRSSGKRNISNSSSKGVFSNPEDQIFEEPETLLEQINPNEITQELPLQSRARNPLLRGSRPLPEKPYTVPLPERPKIDRFEIYRNSPTQSRNAEYCANPPSREATPEVETPKGRAMEIRSEEIRAATSMKRKDRSPKLPTPTAVSDRPGRPIVSFDPTWRPGRESPNTSLDMERPGVRPISALPAMSNSAPVVPTVSLPEPDIPTIEISNDQFVPSISVSEAPSIPSISLPCDHRNAVAAIPSINISTDPSSPQINIDSDSKPAPRPLPSHTHSSPARLPPRAPPRTNRVPWLSRGPMMSGATVTCNACQLPIAGRIVTASGANPGGPKARFHPECFTCHHCSTALECVSFYPEPEAAREERLQQDRESDPSEMRFYCHLDFHDLFSPRCASCKTPIEGAVILAAGKSWHEGHFFCAECGDPFSSTSPFVEDKGYAYCVGCHTKRTSARCRKCKKQILDETCVEALGGKWHDDCFRCDDCDGDFGGDGKFFVREVEIELTEKEKRKGMNRKFEDRAVCQRCEELRLRRVDAFL